MMKARSLTSNMMLLKRICYPASSQFSTAATHYGCDHKQNAIEMYASINKDHINFKVKLSLDKLHPQINT